MNSVRFVISEDLILGPGTRLDHQELLCGRVLLKWKRAEKASDPDIRRGTESAPLNSLSKGVIYFLISYYNQSKECLKVVKILLDPLP